MTSRAPHAVVLPGTGSDARFAQEAFGRGLSSLGATVVAVEPDPRGIVASYEAALDAAADEHDRILVGGISIGAAVAASWALRNPDSTRAVLAVLPAWIGEPTSAPAALSARYTAHRLTVDGLAATTDDMAASTPTWLSTTLARSWASQWPHLPSALLEAADYVAPGRAELAQLAVPTVIVAAVDDPVHPLTVGEIWQTLIPTAALTTVTLAEIGADPAVLGDRAVVALTALLSDTT